MTEEEARSKICHRTMAMSAPLYCVGSACMAWRWLYVATVDNPTREAGTPAHFKRKKTGGYCGLVQTGALET